ncbi:hypothetical protein [Novosphingobium album (ex Liu et al. 2023)]|uniref:SMODS-associating 2TM beta-strand rich effector domain-containing protein n=1 Tax=Novosphingobium album (ex Liu et al. 2023) TaxID=3031130 RepID=A0ABT5WTV6_9SPHN|nr:hypothetical protein [Novosphingobium album (ex Liu et al. 2023)]MDE8653325.1 hypothetical protein [Novosphingobium album (ex Liu et al. 2023)]
MHGRTIGYLRKLENKKNKKSTDFWVNLTGTLGFKAQNFYIHNYLISCLNGHEWLKAAVARIMNIEWWHALIGLLVFAISAAFNLITFVKFLSRSLRTRGFFPGRWHGVIKHSSGELNCVMVLYLGAGELTGQVYYEGRYGDRENVMGYDRLDNDSRDFRLVAKKFRIISQTYEVRFRRVVDSFRQNGERRIDSDTIDYTYRFEVKQRFRHKRITCTVTTKGTGKNDPLTFTGELTSAK